MCLLCALRGSVVRFFKKMKFIDEVKYPSQFIFSGKYRKIRDMIYNRNDSCQKQTNSLPADKKLVKEIWHKQKIERRGVKTVSGDRIFVISPGEWNLNSGPDFKNAVVNINGSETKCDVYAGVYSTDINSNTESSGPECTVLNIFLWKAESGSAAAEPRRRTIHSLELKNYLDSELDIIESNFNIEDYPSSVKVKPGRCASYLMDNYSLIDYIVGLAGDERIISKSKIFEKSLACRSLGEVVYSGIMDGLGYGPNRENFKLLSEKLPIERIEKIVKLEKFEEKPLKIQALLFGMSGLLPEIEKIEFYDEGAKEYVSKIKKIWKIVRSEISPAEIIKSDSWKFRGLRPFNFPYRRLAAASFIISKYIDAGLEKIFYYFYNDLMEGRFNLKRFSETVKLNEFKGTDFWSYRTTFHSKVLSKPVAYIGEERIMLIIINSFLPIAVTMNQDGESGKNIHKWWKKQPACSLNRIAKYTSKKIGFGNMINTERAQQGLLQIFRDFCDTKKGVCSGCDFRNLSGLPATVFFNN